MKGFIEVTPRHFIVKSDFSGIDYIDEDNTSINISNIVSFSQNTIKTNVCDIKVKESYEEIKRLIEEAQS